MKLLMTADTVGGVWTYSMELARALRAHGIEVALATMGAPLSSDQRAEVVSLDHVRVYESTLRLEWMADPWNEVDRAGEWLLAIAQTEHPDVVHLNGYAHATLPFGAPVAVVAHSCVRSWYAAVHGSDAPEGWRVYGDRVTAGLRAASVVVTPTRAMLDALELHYGAIRRSRVIHNGRSASLFPPGEKERFILSAGRLWDEGKNVAALDRIAPSLPWPAYVAGDTSIPGPGVREAREYRNVKSLGRLDRATLAAWLARASIYALPARYEPFGLSVLEAALAGCALVLGDIPSLRELWDDAAFYVPPHDDESIAAIIAALCRDDRGRRALAARARQRALELQPARMASAYAAMYRALVRQRAASGESAAAGVCAS